VRRTHALAQAVVQGVIEVEDDAADQRALMHRRRLPFLLFS